MRGTCVRDVASANSATVPNVAVAFSSQLPSLYGISQTRVSFASRVDIAISLPKFAMDMQARAFAKNITQMRRKFDKTVEADKGKRNELSTKIEHVPAGGGIALKAEIQFYALYAEVRRRYLRT